jgi:CheY-like chemotaxis protein
MSGFEFILRLRQEPWGSAVPVIIWTSMSLSDADRTRFLQSAQAVVEKGGASLDALLRAIQEQCSGSGVREALHGV